MAVTCTAAGLSELNGLAKIAPFICYQSTVNSHLLAERLDGLGLVVKRARVVSKSVWSG
jgi:hypothetical protein